MEAIGPKRLESITGTHKHCKHRKGTFQAPEVLGGRTRGTQHCPNCGPRWGSGRCQGWCTEHTTWPSALPTFDFMLLPFIGHIQLDTREYVDVFYRSHPLSKRGKKGSNGVPVTCQQGECMERRLLVGHRQLKPVEKGFVLLSHFI